MAVTPANVATTLGRSAPTSGTPEFQQWEMWIADTMMLIQQHFGSRFTQLDSGKVDYVVRETVAARVQRPDSASSYTVTVDDGTVTRRYENDEHTSDLRGILEDWWAFLDPADTSGRQAGAFTVKPAGRRRTGCW